MAHPVDVALGEGVMNCAYCGAVATKLCDFRKDAGGKSCDRPLCVKCAVNRGASIVCIRGKGSRRSIQDTVDYCPDCDRIWQEKKRAMEQK